MLIAKLIPDGMLRFLLLYRKHKKVYESSQSFKN